MSAGYKQQCLLDGATAMWSFDGDTFDRTNYSPLTDIIIDDASGETPGRILTDYPALNHIWLGNSSLVEMEQNQQHSLRIARSDGPFAIPPQFPRSMISADHTQHLNFSTNNGSFSVEFFLKKTYDSGFNTICQQNNWIYWYHYSPVMRKKGVFSFYTYQENWYPSQNNKMEFRGPLGTCTCPVTFINFVDTLVHVICTYDLKEMGNNEYQATQTLYVNGRTVQTISRTYYDQSFASNNTNEPFEIGGFSDNPLTGTGSDRADRNTSAVSIDQVSVYKRALTAFECMGHYKKAWTYLSFIKMQGPAIYNDFQSPVALDAGSYKYMNSQVSSVPARIYGTYTPGADGPPIVPGAVGLQLAPNAHIHFVTTSNGVYIPPNTIGDYTIELFFMCESSQPGTIISLQTYAPDFPGWHLEINRNMRGEDEQGTLCFTESRMAKVEANGNFNDGTWHHVAIRRSGTSLDLFVDAEFWQRSTSNWAGISTGPGQIMLFGGPSGNQYAGPGSIAHFAFFNYGMSTAQIESRTVFSIRYEIKGVVTLQGNPFPATIRFYNHRTGDLLQEVMSDAVTGEYKASFATAADVDIVCLDKYDPNVRYRAYGPISPSSEEDFPITI